MSQSQGMPRGEQTVTDDWYVVAGRARARVAQLSQQDKIAIALHDFASVQDHDVIEFDYADGPNGVRRHHGSTAFPSMLAMAASFDRPTRSANPTAAQGF